MLLRPAAFWDEHDVAIVAGVRVREIDRAGRRVVAEDGAAWDYGHLVLATGSRNRTLPGLPDAFGLRTVAEARAIRERLGPDAALAVVGGGFIGLELAAAARHHGTAVTVVEAQDRLMARALSPEMAAHLQREHERHGVVVRLGRVAASRDADGLVLDDGERIAAGTVVVGVGVIPNDELATQAGLETGDGIVVDAHLQTSDPHISAIGDCARHDCGVTGADLRLESVQNATDQAAHVAARLIGEATPYVAVPWFWTGQYASRCRSPGSRWAPTAPSCSAIRRPARSRCCASPRGASSPSTASTAPPTTSPPGSCSPPAAFWIPERPQRRVRAQGPRPGDRRLTGTRLRKSR